MPLIVTPVAYTQIHTRVGSDGYIATDDRSSKVDLISDKSGGKVPAFKELIAKGSEATSEYTLDAYSGKNYAGQFTASNIKFQGSNVVYTDTFQGTLFPAGPFDHVFDSETELTSKALANFYKSLRKSRTQLESLQVIGEGAQTIQMLRNPFQALTNVTVKTYRALNKERARLSRLKRIARDTEWSKVITRSYLEWVFGVKPLISDINDAIEALSRIDEVERTRIVGTANQSSSYVSEPLISKIVGDMALTYQKRESRTTEQGVKFIGFLDKATTVAQDRVGKVKSLFGFNLESFIPSIYECMPYSWLLDYITNTGDIITAGTTSTVDLKFCVKMIKSESSCIINTLGENPNGSIAFLQSGNVLGFDGAFGNSVTRRTTFKRRKVPIDSLGVPSFRMFHPGDNISKYLNVLAVMNEFRSMERNNVWKLPRRG